eukprot:TCONS_00021725-protein
MQDRYTIMFILKKYFIVILLLESKTFGVRAHQHDYKYDRTYRDKRSTLHTYLKLKNLNELGCILACSNDFECGSINYNKELKFCELNEIQKDNDQHTELLKIDKGWNHFIKRKSSPAITPVSQEFSIPGEIVPERNKLVHIIPTQEKTWELSFEFKILQKQDGVTSLIRLMDENCKTDHQQIGCRTPAIFLASDRLHITFSSDINPNQNINTGSFALNQKHKFKMRRGVNSCKTPSKQYTSIYINDVLLEEFEHHGIQPTSTNVQVYVADGYWPKAPAVIFDLKYTHDALYPGNLFELRSGRCLAYYEQWPPSDSWFVSFDYMITSAVPIGYRRMIQFKEIGSARGQIGYWFPFLERVRNSMRFKTAYWINGQVSSVCANQDLTPFVGRFVPIRIEQIKQSDGRTFMSLYVDGNKICTTENTTPETVGPTEFIIAGYFDDEPRIVFRDIKVESI